MEPAVNSGGGEPDVSGPSDISTFGANDNVAICDARPNKESVEDGDSGGSASARNRVGARIYA